MSSVVVRNLLIVHDFNSIRLKNIEETEKAKRILFEEKQKGTEEDNFAADRCKIELLFLNPKISTYDFFSFFLVYRARRPLESDSDALAKARKAAAGEPIEQKKPKHMGGKREMATDDQVLDRFKKRERKGR